MAVLLQQRNGLRDLMRNSLLFCELTDSFYTIPPMNFQSLVFFSHKVILTMAVSQLYAHFLICMCVSAYVNILVAGGRGRLEGPWKEKNKRKGGRFDTITYLLRI